jgi:sporulation protein YlmC with PRC-barrel domain
MTMAVEQPFPAVGAVDIQPGMPVRGAAGKLLGSIGRIVTDEETGEVTTFTIKHGLFDRKVKEVPVHEIKQVTDEAVILRFTKADFKLLPDIGDKP